MDMLETVNNVTTPTSSLNICWIPFATDTLIIKII